jgi:hypothetical protein
LFMLNNGNDFPVQARGVLPFLGSGIFDWRLPRCPCRAAQWILTNLL